MSTTTSSEPEQAAPQAGRWPDPPAPAGTVVLAATAGAGLMTAALVPVDRPGLGWAIAGLAVAAAVAAAVRWSRAAPDAALRGRRRWEPLVWTVVALALLSVGTVRAAGWLFALCVCAAAAAVVLALTGGRTARGLALATLLVPVAAGRGAAWAWEGFAALRSRARSPIRMGRTAVVTVAVLVVFGGLLVSADAAFSGLVDRVLPSLDVASVLRWTLLFLAAAGLVLAAAYLMLAPARVDPADPRPSGGHVRPLEWAMPVGALVALFSGFVTVQLTVLFGGAAYVLGPDGPTYAEYARSGF